MIGHLHTLAGQAQSTKRTYADGSSPIYIQNCPNLSYLASQINPKRHSQFCELACPNSDPNDQHFFSPQHHGPQTKISPYFSPLSINTKKPSDQGPNSPNY
jgi:hypothetical protein